MLCACDHIVLFGWLTLIKVVIHSNSNVCVDFSRKLYLFIEVYLPSQLSSQLYAAILVCTYYN